MIYQTSQTGALNITFSRTREETKNKPEGSIQRNVLVGQDVQMAAECRGFKMVLGLSGLSTLAPNGPTR